MIDRGARRVIDVEDVVAWAYGDELNKRRATETPYNLSRHDASLVGRWTSPPGFPEISPMFRSVFAGGGSASTAGSSWDHARLPPGAGAPDPDALAIETAIAALGETMAGLTAPEELALDLGFPVDVDGAFAAALANVVNIVRVHGALKRRPVLGVESPNPQPVMGVNGKTAIVRMTTVRFKTVERDESGRQVEARREAEAPAARIRSDLYEAGAFCKLKWDPDPKIMVNERAEYLIWRLALDRLAGALSGKLARFAVIAPSAPLAPWLGDRDSGKPAALMAQGVAGVYTALEILTLEARLANRERRRPNFRRQDLRRPQRPGRSATGDGVA
jgi:hypothetical protein